MNGQGTRIAAIALIAGLVLGFLLAVALGLVSVAASPSSGPVLTYRRSVCLGFGIGLGVLVGIALVNALVGALDRLKTELSAAGADKPLGVTRSRPGGPGGNAG